MYKRQDSLLSNISRDIYRQYGSSLEQELISELTKGYDEKKEQKVLKEFYVRKLNEACLLIDVIIAGAKACKGEKSDLIKEMQDAYTHSVDLGMDGDVYKRQEQQLPLFITNGKIQMHFWLVWIHNWPRSGFRIVKKENFLTW